MPKYYLVGGYVRDELLGIKSKDVDFAVEDATFEEMRNDILAMGGTIFQERPEFLSIRAKIPEYGPADFTLCRTDGFYSDARRPDEVHVGTIYDDLARRDFTINAIAKLTDAASSITYLDPHGGMVDLDNKILRCVGDPVERFNEDSLRIIRAIRFNITRNFTLHPSIEYCLNDWSILEKLYSTSTERIYEELKRCYEHSNIQTMLFFRAHRKLEDMVFFHVGLRLTPVI